jgi:adenosylcobinamide-GDP ribazoletransferase
VAGSVRVLPAAALVAAVLAAAGAIGWIFAAAVVAGLVASAVTTLLATRRLGGITGDVLGAVAEITATACLLVTALR